MQKLLGDNIVLRATISTLVLPQRANVARIEAFAYYCDAELPCACHIVYKAWLEGDGKTPKYELTQTPFPPWTAQWDEAINKITGSWGPDWLDDEYNIFMLVAPYFKARVNAHPAVLTHLARMHGMLLSPTDDPFAQVLRDIALKRIDGAIKQMNSQWAKTIGL